MSTSGSCLCGSVQYTFTGAPAVVGVCHCLTCQKLTGSAFTTNVIIPASSFSLTSGSLKSYSLIHPTGLNLTKNFCAECGSTITKVANGGFDGTLLLQAGTIDNVDGTSVGQHGKGVVAGKDGKEVGVQRALTKPGVELWVSQKAAWLPALDGAASFEEFTPGTLPAKI